MVDEIVREFVGIKRIIKLFGESDERFSSLIGSLNVQPSTGMENVVRLRKDGRSTSGMLVDFGREIYGGIRLTTGNTSDNSPVRVRIRFGESVSEALHGGSNDHGMHDFKVFLPWMGCAEHGSTGFRFVRVDLVDDGSIADLQGFCAVAQYRDLAWIGNFECSDELLNRIWKTATYTVQLSMQDYIWDGIKRDRLVWAGDLHPEVSVIATIFGKVPVVTRTLDFLRDRHELPGWMNGISSYTLWWIVIHYEWYKFFGDVEYLCEQRDYLAALVTQLEMATDEFGAEKLPEMRFLDWPTSGDETALHAGLHSLMIIATAALGDMLEVLGEHDGHGRCADLLTRLKGWKPELPDRKQAAALMAISNPADAFEINSAVLACEPFSGISTFYGYYVLEARALAGDYQGCLDLIRQYWGQMIELGATTFWEGFDLSWTENASRIDEIVPPGKTDLHADFGEFCYTGLRHSLCHGWAGGPAAWLIHHVLGLKVTKPGARVVEARPHLCDLEWAKGALATPFGPVTAEYEREASGAVRSSISSPEQVIIVE